jgi:hypothetical protein
MAFRSGAISHGNSRQPSVVLPTGAGAPQPGDRAIMIVADDGSAVSGYAQANWPSGFTRSGAGTLTGVDGQTYAYGYKDLTAADTGSYTFAANALSLPIQWSCAVLFFSGRDAGTAPTFTDNPNNSANTGTNIAAPATGVTAASGDDLCWALATDTNTSGGYNGATAPTSPGTWTKQIDGENPVGWSAIAAATRDNVAAGATGTVTGHFALSGGSSGFTALLARLPAAAGGAPHNVTLTPATETDAAQGLVVKKQRALVPAAETEAAQPRAVSKRTGTVPAAETDAAQALVYAKPIHVALAPATERDFAGLAVSKVARLTPATETDAAQPLAIGQAHTTSVVPATEADAALPVKAVKRVTLVPATETDIGIAPKASHIRGALTAAVETDSGLALKVVKRVVLQPAPEADAAVKPGVSKRAGHGIALEVDAAQPVTHTRRVALIPAVETDAAQQITYTGPTRVALTPATEADAAQPLSYVKPKRVTLAPATETDQAPPLAHGRLVGLSPAVEADAARPLVVSRFVRLAPGTEADAAQGVVAARLYRLVAASEAEAAQALAVGKRLDLGVATETDMALGLARQGGPQLITLTPALEVDVALPLARSTLGFKVRVAGAWVSSTRRVRSHGQWVGVP